jgi:hypothetical protein
VQVQDVVAKRLPAVQVQEVHRAPKVRLVEGVTAEQLDSRVGLAGMVFKVNPGLLEYRAPHRCPATKDIQATWAAPATEELLANREKEDCLVLLVSRDRPQCRI